LCIKALVETFRDSKLKVFWAIAEKEGERNSFWKGFSTIYSGNGCIGAQQQNMYNMLLSDFDKVLLSGVDIPQLTHSIIDKAVQKQDHDQFVVGPANDGGYYLFGGSKRLRKNMFTRVNWNRSNTLEQLESIMLSKLFKLPYLTDIDEFTDLYELKAEMPSGMNQNQKKLMHWINYNFMKMSQNRIVDSK
jgi:glycosyltransferase A (GT-A) superfamily protein (DUF2064 family)